MASVPRPSGSSSTRSSLPLLANTGAMRSCEPRRSCPGSRSSGTPRTSRTTTRADQRLHASLILGFADASARAAFFDSDEIAALSDRLSVFASAVHAYEVSEALTYVKEGKILPHYQA